MLQSCEARTLVPSVERLLNLAERYRSTGDLAEATQVFFQAISIDDGTSARVAFLRFLLQQERNAEACHQAGLLLNHARVGQDLALQKLAYSSLASAHRMRSEFDMAARYEQLAISAGQKAISRNPTEPMEAPCFFSDMATDALQRGELNLAEELLRRSIAANSTPDGSQTELADDWGNLGAIAALRGELRHAVACFWNALKLHRELRDFHGEGCDLLNLAEVAWETGHRRLAFRCYRRAVAAFEEIEEVNAADRARQMLHRAVKIAEVTSRDLLLN